MLPKAWPVFGLRNATSDLLRDREFFEMVTCEKSGVNRGG